MPTRSPLRLPISTRHAFALAFDLALRRDLPHSMIVPFVLRAPWLVAYAVLPTLFPDRSPRLLTIAAAGLLGDFLVSLVIGAMLRIRARSVFNTPQDAKPLAASICYAQGVRRVPWLIVTEIVRNVALALAWSFSILPAVLVRLGQEGLVRDLARNLMLVVVAGLLTLPALFLGFRLAVATESVVLHEHDLADAFMRSFRIMHGRFERWLEIIVASALLALAVLIVESALMVLFPPLGTKTGIGILFVVAMSVTPIIQYAWTFFYLRLVEIDDVQPRPDLAAAFAAPAGYQAPRLGLVRPANGPQARPDPED